MFRFIANFKISGVMMLLLTVLTSPARSTTFTAEAALIDFRPSSWTEGAQLKGAYVDFLHDLESRIDAKISVRTFPYLRAIAQVKSKAADFTISPDSPESESIGGKKIFLNLNRYLLLTPKDKPVCSMKDIKGVIGRLRGGCANILASKEVSFFDVTASYQQGLTMLENKRLNGFCGVERGLRYWIRFMKLDPSQFRQYLIGDRGMWMRFAPNYNPAHFKKIEKAVTILLKEGRLQKIQDGYDNPPVLLQKATCSH